jgi:hypothetical protein
MDGIKVFEERGVEAAVRTNPERAPLEQLDVAHVCRSDRDCRVEDFLQEV